MSKFPVFGHFSSHLDSRIWNVLTVFSNPEKFLDRLTTVGALLLLERHCRHHIEFNVRQLSAVVTAPLLSVLSVTVGRWTLNLNGRFRAKSVEIPISLRGL